jgi:DHA1 family multidrug resistance protein-like MFS transporter
VDSDAIDRTVAGRTPQKVSLRAILSDPAVRVVLLMIFVIMLGFGIVAPILPLYARSFGVSYRAASLLISAFAFTRLITDPFSGRIVDRFGERLSAMAGVLIVGVSAFLAGLPSSFRLVVLLRAAGGAGSSVFFSALYSYLLRVVPRDRMARTMSVFYGTLNVGIIAGGPIGGIVAHAFGLASPLFIYSGLCLGSGLLYLRFLPQAPDATAGSSAPRSDESTHAPRGTTFEQVRTLLRTPAFPTVLMLNLAFSWLATGVYDTLVPLFAKEGLGVSTVGVGAIFAMAVAGEFCFLYPAATMADRVGRRPVVVASFAAMAIMIPAVGWAGSPIMLGLLVAVLGFSSGAAAGAPAAMLSDVAPGRGSGTAVGVFRFAGDLGFMLGPFVAGVSVSAFGFKGAFAVMAIPAIVSVAFALRTKETLHRSDGVPPGRLRESIPQEEPGTL